MNNFITNKNGRNENIGTETLDNKNAGWQLSDKLNKKCVCIPKFVLLVSDQNKQIKIYTVNK